ncbi:unnamed protein product [Darwinula stevensoni]|uniref:Uncharacterized protein n=1 Tax=Darwinula stevensoni TaxID=69355 RepID=A0A7R9AD34_9CRUS|nr:unnamed protein product [Darwinula stevensoni]CAG0900745.1 unnamed protein product [Darwinula stevensoni]
MMFPQVTCEVGRLTCRSPDDARELEISGSLAYLFDAVDGQQRLQEQISDDPENPLKEDPNEGIVEEPFEIPELRERLRVSRPTTLSSTFLY